MTVTNNEQPKTLVVILGATATGKTDLTLQLARHFGTEILSADSRQVYREIPIGTAAPAPDQLAAVPHHLIATRSVTEDYSAGRYEADALQILDTLFQTHPVVFMTGGSGLYIDAVCDGMDAMPDIDPEIRERLNRQVAGDGLSSLLEQLEALDPLYFGQVDKSNPQRVIRALEVCLQTGLPYSGFRKKAPQARPFRILKIGIQYPRELLYERIDLRVDRMMRDGLEEEAHKLYPLKSLNALQTVGYKELFDYFDGATSLEKAVGLIKQNSRRYAKRQQTWFGRDQRIHWIEAGRESPESIAAYIRSRIAEE